jgi:hypothetical protein
MCLCLLATISPSEHEEFTLPVLSLTQSDVAKTRDYMYPASPGQLKFVHVSQSTSPDAACEVGHHHKLHNRRETGMRLEDSSKSIYFSVRAGLYPLSLLITMDECVIEVNAGAQISALLGGISKWIRRLSKLKNLDDHIPSLTS